ncbi:MAG: hypothetical protein RLZZ502_1271 [Pseudomonadota bacterium]|jgi:homogentisate 1,2-dioxygenase
MNYQSGFGNYFASEALPGVLPQGRNSPQQVAHGLYAELISASAFTAPRKENLRTWVYRRLPSVRCLSSGEWSALPHATLKTGLSGGVSTPPLAMRWAPMPLPTVQHDFIDGLVSMVVNGDAEMQVGMAAHVYTANVAMERVFVNTDGEMLFVPEQGAISIKTELGVLNVGPGQIAVVPRGMAMQIRHQGVVRGYVCENYGAAFRLPELGPIGSNGLANARDFLSPVAAFDAEDTPTTLIKKQGGQLWQARTQVSPFNVVAWHGNLTPYQYDCAHFNTIGTVSFDHPDPSIFTVLTSPSDTPGTANVDFVIFPPRWMVAEDTFRPPWFHRNIMSEFMGLIHGQYDAKPDGFKPGGMSLHNQHVPHGPDAQAYDKATTAALAPHKIDHTLAFMFESRWRFRVTEFAINTEGRDRRYSECWTGLPNNFKGSK